MSRPTETAPRCSWLRDTPRPPGVPPWLVCVRDKCVCRDGEFPAYLEGRKKGQEDV
jgi:hypothetical protein